MKRHKVYRIVYDVPTFDIQFEKIQDQIESRGERIEQIKIDGGNVFIVTSIGFEPGEKVEK